MKTHVIVVGVVIMIIACTSCSNKQEDYARINKACEEVVFEHTPMPKYSKDYSQEANWQSYGQYVDSLVLPIAGIHADCCLAMNESAYKFIYVSDQVDRSNNQLILIFDSPDSLYYRVQVGRSQFLMSTTANMLEGGQIQAGIIGPNPVNFVSKDVWELLYCHELMHVIQCFQGSNLSQESAEIPAYLKEMEVLEQKNLKVFSFLIRNCGEFYKKYGFCEELKELCGKIYQTDKLSFVERNMVEPGLMLIVAMKVENITTEKDAKMMKKLLEEFDDFLQEYGAIKYGK